MRELGSEGDATATGVKNFMLDRVRCIFRHPRDVDARAGVRVAGRGVRDIVKGGGGQPEMYAELSAGEAGGNAVQGN